MKFLVRKMIYPGSFVGVPDSPPEPLRQLELSLSNKNQALAWYFIKDPDLPFLIYFHGNAENVQTVWLSGMVGQLQALEVNFMIMEYPGFGRSRGTPHENTLLESASKGVNWIDETYPGSKIVACGWSLGAAVAVLTARQFPEKIHGLIALSAWTSLEEVAKIHYPDWLVNRFLREKYSSIEAAEQVVQPVLLIHGGDDYIIPAAHSVQLAPKFPDLYEHLIIEGAHHNDLLGYPEVWRSMKQFVKSLSP